jgi:predicted ATPase
VSVTAGKRGKRPGLTEENRLWTVKQRLVNAKAHESMSSSSSLAGGSPYEEVLQRVRDIWDMFYPGKHESFSVEPVGTDPDEGFDVYLNTSEGGRIPLNSLSSGQLELFLLAGSAIPYQPDASIICIDEPELHLDPQWHRLILRAMMKLRPNCQFIVGTHSPEVYDSVMSYERHFLVPDDDPRARAWAEIGKEDPEACSRT